MANSLTEMVMVYDMDRKLVFVNPAVETLTGYSPEEMKRANFICWIHPEDQPRMLALWESLFQGQSFHEQEYRLLTKDGRMKWAVGSWTPIRDESGRQVGVQGRDIDITHRKLAETAQRHSEQQLRADEERYRALFENSPFPMWEEDFSEVRRYLDSLSQAGGSLREHLSRNRSAVEECVRRVRVLDVNGAARRFYGAATKDELLAGLEGIFDETALEVFRDEMATLAENHDSFQTEFWTRTLKGEERLVHMIVSIVESARHDWSRLIVSFFDITDRKRLEEEFVQLQKMESLGRLAGGIAHDFNNLLTVINGYSDWMLQEMSEENPFRARLAEVRAAGAQCAELTQQLLAFSRKQVIRPGPLDLNRLIRESQGMLDRILGDDIQVRTQLTPDLGTVTADRSQMHQVLINLAVNAREAMPSGGTLTIATRNHEDPPEVVLEMRDTGHGIDKATRQHLFEPFFTTRKTARNTGLGLATVFGIVSHAGGRIDVDSEPGAGATFRICLPRAQAMSEEAVPAARPRPHGGAGLVLVVDDRDDVRTLICRMLQELGYRVLAASGGDEALTMASRETEPIPVVLTDVVMPGMNGSELVREMRNLYPGIRAIFMSGYTDRILSDTGALDACASYLQKPFTLAQLAGVLRQADES
jgi:two-component system cell cycle sensor histidine kinase/response regulator CckA